MKYIVSLNGKDYEVEVEQGKAIMVDVRDTVAPVAPVAATISAPATPTASAPTAQAAVSGTKIEAPLPGVVIEVKATQGQAVKEGDVILVVEAMKMANDITAPCDGTVGQIAVNKNQQVNKGDLLAVIS